MKIQFNQTFSTNRYNSIANQNNIKKSDGRETTPQTSELAPSGLSLANFANVSFGMNSSMKFLLANTNKLRCAYSGRAMISPYEIRTIYSKLAKRPNAQSAINLLIHYEDYMHDVESQVFDMFKESPHKGKRTFQDILKDNLPESLERLKIKQFEILTSVERQIKGMSAPIAEQIRASQSEAASDMELGTFSRKKVLEMVKNIKASGEDLPKVIKVYQTWYKLPKAGNNFDAFVVKYAKEPHDAIARRLLSTSVATVEHVQPASRGGADDMSNFLLVSARFNNDRNSMPLDEYIMLNQDVDIPHNIQKYIDDVIDEIGNKKSAFSSKSWYPEAIRKTIAKETSHKVDIDLADLHLSKEQKKQNSCTYRLSEKYDVSYK